MNLEILFKDASAPKKVNGATTAFTKGDFYCVRVGDLLIKYPMINIFSVCHLHGDHLGSGKSIEEAKRERAP
jgi:hypothetical protein